MFCVFDIMIPDPLLVGNVTSRGTLGYVFSFGRILLAAVVYTSLLLNELFPSFYLELTRHLELFFYAN